MPTCGRDAHEGWRVDSNGTYDTATGSRQRYRCSNPDDPAERHTFTAPLPHSAVEDDTCRDDCRLPTPRHAGSEVSTRRLNYRRRSPTAYRLVDDGANGLCSESATARNP